MGTANKGTENPWKDKAVARSKKIKILNKEIVRHSTRASSWRSKSLEQGKLLRSQAQIINSMTLHINELSEELLTVGRRDVAQQSGQKIHMRGYKYPLMVIWLCLILYRGGLSLRGTCSVLEFIRDFLGIKFKIPSYGTVRTWVYKQGLYMLKKGGEIGDVSKKSGEKWVLIVDESYSLGKSRLLLVLALRLSSLKAGQRITISDCQPIEIRSSETWKGDEVAAVLNDAAEKINGEIAYVVSDRGNNLVNAYQAVGLLHVPDWSHYVANILENIYVQNDDFKLFNELMGKFKKKRKQSIFSDYSPPTLSVKMRFMNYIPFLEWANIMLDNFKNIPFELVAELQFLQKLEPFITEMTDLFYKGDAIGLLLKTNGICPQTQKETMAIKDALLKKYPNNPRVTCFAEGINVYFDTTMPIYTQYVGENENITPIFNKIIASSEVIESIFGKFKHRCLKDPKRGFSAIVLLIPLFCRQFSPFDVFKAMSSISCTELDLWQDKNLTKKGYSSFRNVFKKFQKKVKKGGGFAQAA
jgi:hypothetical protein